VCYAYALRGGSWGARGAEVKGARNQVHSRWWIDNNVAQNDRCNLSVQTRRHNPVPTTSTFGSQRQNEHQMALLVNTVKLFTVRASNRHLYWWRSDRPSRSNYSSYRCTENSLFTELFRMDAYVFTHQNNMLYHFFYYLV